VNRLEDSDNPVADWLQELELGHFARSFEENGIDWEFLPGLSNNDLKELGVVRLRDRKILLAAIARLGGGHRNGAIAKISSAVAPEAERRQLTVMFCDLAGSTELSTQLDPE